MVINAGWYQLAPLLEEMGGGYNLKDARRRASEALRKKGVEEARRRAKDAAIREAVRQAGYGDAGALIVGDDGNDGRELLGELREILSDEAANFASGQLMMRAPLLKRLATLAAVTPAEDVEFLRRNKRRLPKDMRWDD